jgi:hypothetical protein
MHPGVASPSARRTSRSSTCRHTCAKSGPWSHAGLQERFDINLIGIQAATVHDHQLTGNPGDFYGPCSLGTYNIAYAWEVQMYSILDLDHNLAMISSNKRTKLRVRARLRATENVSVPGHSRVEMDDSLEALDADWRANFQPSRFI